MNPIFIHAMWRTGSTYVWKKFRDQPQYRAYYEPLHEGLAVAKPIGRLLPPVAAAFSIGIRNTAMRHPKLDRSYLHEYPLRWLGGMACFEQRFAYERYCLADDASDEPLRRYVAHLLAFAAAKGQTAVLQFNRSLLRSGWLKRHFPSTSILLLRRPIDVWRSFRTLDPYFGAVLLQIVSLNRDHPYLGKLACEHAIPRHQTQSAPERHALFRDYFVQRADDLYPLFYEFYLFTCIHNMRRADCVMDMNAITESPSARVASEQRLAECGITLSLDDCRMPRYADLTAQEHRWLAYEAQGGAAVRAYLADAQLIPGAVLRQRETALSDYFLQVFGEFVRR